jgi:glycine cleavage system transcriptional repressor
MEQYLVISALGGDRPGLVSDITKAIYDCGGNVVDSRMVVLGGEFAVMLLVSGEWNQIAKIETVMESLQRTQNLTIVTKRTETAKGQAQAAPYSVEVVAIDHPGIVHQVANFLSGFNINIQELRTDRYAAPHTGTPMFSVHMVIHIPAQIQIARFREQFFDYCDRLNLDAILEPIK